MDAAALFPQNKLDTSCRKTRKWCAQFFMKVFAELFSKSDRNSSYLLASSITTATATCHLKQPAVVANHGVVLLGCFLNSNSYSNGHTNHGVVTCTDKSHHLYDRAVRHVRETMPFNSILRAKHIIQMCSLSHYRSTFYMLSRSFNIF